MIDDLLGRLAGGWLAEAVRGTPYLYPVLESIHVLGIALLVGPAAVFDLRLLGLARHRLRVTTAAEHLLPISRLGFAVAATTGVVMFLPGADLMPDRGSAPWKLGLLLVAGLNVLVFHRLTYRGVRAWDADQPPPAAARVAAVVSLTSWTGVTLAGRLLAYT